MKDRRTRVFVYGTLMQGERNHLLIASDELVGPARTAPHYELVNLETYPALIRGGHTAVSGEVYAVAEDTLVALDELEGHPEYYQRGLIVLEDGALAQAYLLPRHEVVDQPRLLDGRWRQRAPSG